ncbi:MAG TPA: nucleotide disphospho-sugar-binding domain-containing protein [Solirubrobacterales bacterium]
MGSPLRVIVSAGFGEGHAFPALALSRALAGRGHEVAVELAERWRGTVAGLGLDFLPGREYAAFPSADPGAAGPTVADAARSLAETIEGRGADLVVADLVAPAAALAAELTGLPHATLIPTLYPVQGEGLPPYAQGLRPPRSALGAAAWRGIERAVRPLRPQARWLERVPALVDENRRQLGLAPLGDATGRITTYGPISAELALVATFPQLEPRRLPANVELCGPMLFEVPHPEVDLPGGDAPLVLIAPSTTHAVAEELVGVALDALAGEPARVVATLNRRGERWTGATPANAAVVDWLSYAQVMARTALVVSSGGHGTIVRALAAGVPVLVCPAGADTAENGARLTAAGAGLMVPEPLLSPTALRWAARRILRDRRFHGRAAALGEWARGHDGAERGAVLVEELAARGHR